MIRNQNIVSVNLIFVKNKQMQCRYTIIRFIATTAKPSNAKRSKEGTSTDIGYHMINLGLFLPCDQDRHNNRKCPMKYLERNKHKHYH